VSVAASAAGTRPGPAITDRSWFDRPSLEFAPDLLGKRLVHESADGTVAGRIVETEAYACPEDLAAHSSRGRTPRNAVMFGPPGHLYVYLIYGLHHCLNVVCGPGVKPEAVLIRAAEIDEGETLARGRRRIATHVSVTRLAAGPGNVAAAFGIDRSLNGVDLTSGPVYLSEGAAPDRVVARPRVGVAYAGEWATLHWRFLVADDPHVSRR